jgi:protein involved in polysaccharide export with SLBB domain
MKNVTSFIFLALLVTSSWVSAQAQQSSEQPKQKASDERKTQISGTAAALSANATPATGSESLAKPGSTELASADPNSEAHKRYESGVALSEAGNLDEAIAAFKESLKLKPEDAQTYFSMGMTYSKSKSYKEAFDSFKLALRYQPDWPEAHFRLGVMSYVLGKRNQATDEYKKLKQINSPLANILYRIVKGESAAGVVENVSATDPAAVMPATDASVKTTSAPTNQNSTSESPLSNAGLPVKPASVPAPLTEIYRVGVGDVLDVRFLNSANGRSTLFTVIGGGVIDLPVAGGPISVAGLTPDEIQSRIAAELKRRAVEESAQISVGVRQYVSHSVMVTGLVTSPGARVLRREAVPLYVILAESQLRNDAGRVVIMRAGSAGQSLDLGDPHTLNTNVISGDVITVTSRPQEFYYIAGRINYPGQKLFQRGITLLQAILAAGGTSRQNEKIVEVSREGDDGRLVTTRFNLKAIKAGEVEDPKLQPGDRIEVVH